MACLSILDPLSHIQLFVPISKILIFHTVTNLYVGGSL
jgi:hypothetical protein